MVIDRTEKPKISSKFAKRAVQYNKFGYKYKQCELMEMRVVKLEKLLEFKTAVF